MRKCLYKTNWNKGSFVQNILAGFSERIHFIKLTKFIRKMSRFCCKMVEYCEFWKIKRK